jgi:ABC-type multidrug transport system ATPase subunit
VTAQAPALVFNAVAYVAGGSRILDRLSLTLDQGERLAVHGANASGKSVLARLAAAFEAPISGEVLVFGANPARLGLNESRRLRSHIGMVLQGGSLLADLTVEDNLRLGLGSQSRASLRRQGARIDRALLDFRLEGVAGRIVDRLSTGEQRRVEFARAFLRDPDLLILDDPFQGVDAVSAAELEAHTLRLLARRPRACLLLTQDLALARRFAATVARLESGRLVQHADGEATPAATSWASASAARDMASEKASARADGAPPLIGEVAQ